MAKFCTKCGKALEEGQVCDCQANQPVAASSTSSVDVSKYVNSYLEVLKGIFTKPVDTIKKFVTESNFVLGIIALVIKCIISGIFVYFLAKEALGAVLEVMGAGDGFASMISDDIPFMKVFIYGFLFVAVWHLVIAGMVFLIANVIMKDKISFKDSLILVAIPSVFTTVTTLVALVTLYISSTVMFIVLALATVFYLVYLAQGLRAKTEIDANKFAYVFVPSIAVAYFVVCYVLPKIFG